MPINHELVGSKCTTCGFIPTEEIYAHAIKLSHTVYDSSLCIQCAEGYKDKVVSHQNKPCQSTLKFFLNEQLQTYAPLIIPLYERTNWTVNVIDVMKDTLPAKEYNDQFSCYVNVITQDRSHRALYYPLSL